MENKNMMEIESCTWPSFTINLVGGTSIYDRPVDKKEEGNRLYLRYNAIGIPADKLIVQEEFVNKTGEMFLDCTVEHHDKFWGSKQCVDIHYKVDTDVYESWDSFVENGYLVIVLNERKREQPDFHHAMV